MFNRISMEVLEINLYDKKVYLKMPFKLGCGGKENIWWPESALEGAYKWIKMK